MGKKILLEKLKDSIMAILPLSTIILIIALLTKTPTSYILAFLVGVGLLIIGLTLFSIGSFQSTMAIAESIGEYIVQKKRFWFFILIAFLVGFLITLAEPALWVLSDQIKSVILEPVLIITVAFGVGLFLMLGLIRILFQFKLRTLFIISYGLLFIVALLVSIFNPEFIPLAFDSGGVTTGPMAVPFIMALGLGISKARGDRASEEDSFGLIGVASIGPILSVLLLGLFNRSSTPVFDTETSLWDYLSLYLGQMAIAISPFILFFLAFHLFVFKFKQSKVIKIIIAFVYTYLGLVLFLTGANAGLVNLGLYLGRYLATLSYQWILIPVGVLFGITIITAEPSVIALNKQVEAVSAGAINRRFMMVSLSLAVGLAIGLSMVRILYQVSIWWFLIPGYLMVIVLTFFTPKLFSSIAFDSGGAVSGAMTSAFLIPFALGAAFANGSNILLDAFGLVTFVAMMPLITIQWLGLRYQAKLKKAISMEPDDEIIELSEVKKS